MKRIGSAIARYFHLTDKWLLFFWVGASTLSVVFLLGLYNSGGIGYISTIQTQAMASVLGLVSALVISNIDYHLLLKLWKLYVPLCLLLIIFTFIPSLGTIRGDNQAWISFQIAGYDASVQPSEILKISFITTFSMHLAKAREEQKELNRLPNIILLCLHAGVHVLAIQIQGDSGSALVFIGIFLAMIFCAGINWRYIAAAVVALAAVAPLLWFKVMSDDQKMRILVLLNPGSNEDYAYQQMQGLTALGRGGIQGTGIFNGKHVWVPEAYNDFIFAFIGESAGFVGSLGVIVLLSVIAFKILYNSSLAKDDEGRFICIGVFAMIVSQTVINLGMCLSLLPVIGITLPLFSYGGTSVLSMYLGLGLVLSVYCHSKTALFFD